MRRVLIVDDEEPVIEGYSFLVDGYRGEFAVAGVARSGYEAMQRIHELRPDVVFMDINIPGMDGIEVIEGVHRKFPETVFILSTAYERFDLARRAIPLRVFEYLVKPVSKRTLLSTLDAVAEHLDGRRGAAPAGAEGLAERQFLMETIWRPIPAEDWERYRALFGFGSDKGVVCLVEADGERPGWAAEVAERLSFRYRCLSTLVANRGIFLISEDADREALSECLAQAVEAVVPDPGSRAWSVGSVRHGTELGLSCEDALEGLGPRGTGSDARKGERFRVVQLRRRIGVSGQGDMRSLFDAHCGKVFASADFGAAKAKMVALFTLLLEDAGAYGDGSVDAEPPFDPAEEIAPLADLPAWEEWRRPAFEKVLALFARKRAGRFPGPLARAIDFIDERYTEPIQLGSVAEAAKVSAAYLSRLFSEHLRTSFVDYLTALRIDQAERLLRETALSVKEIAFSVGIQDPNYFSKLFRKATGASPTLYAAELRGNPDADGGKGNP